MGQIMSAKGPRGRLEFLTRETSAAEWRLLGALAVERELGVATLQRLAAAFGISVIPRSVVGSAGGSASGRVGAARGAAGPVLLPALERWRDSGLLVELSRSRTSSALQGSEPAFSVHPEFRQLVLRRLAAQGDLQAVVEACHVALGERSLGVLVLLLQTGRLGEFQRYAYNVPRAASRLGEEIDADELLREAILRPFDAAWFEAVWAESATAAALRVARDALPRLHECDPLFAWLLERLGHAPSPASAAGEESPNLQIARQTLAEHAFLRDRPELVESLADTLPRAERLGFRAAAAYQAGDQAGAQRWLDALAEASDAPSGLLGESKRPRTRTLAPDIGAAAPLLALLAFSRGTPGSHEGAKRWLNSRALGNALAGVERGFRTLLRYAALPEAECQRLDVHQLGLNAHGWELLLLGLTVHLYLKQDVTRASWSIALTRAGARWLEAGYSWFGRQGLLLARALSETQFEREYSGLGVSQLHGAFAQRPGEFALCDLITPKPEWERALDALERLAEEPKPADEGARRVAWYVNLVDRTLERPSLQELSQSGWSRGRRMPLGQLYGFAAELPPEDRAVLACTRELAEGKREFAPEAFEALIGHPRVFNGARGGARVEITRGQCRVETRDDHGFIEIHVEPAGARLGVNLVLEGENRLGVYRVSAALQRVIDLLPHGLRVPEQRSEQALRVLGKLSHGVEVNSKHLGADRHVAADATPCLRIAPHAGAWIVQAGVRPFGERGRFFLAGTGRPQISLYTGGERLLCTRDLKLERARLSLLILSCPLLLEHGLGDEELGLRESPGSWDFDLESLLELLLELKESGERCEIEWPESSALRVRGQLTTQGLQGTLRRKKGWYLAAGSVQLDDDTELELGELAGSVGVARGRFVRLPNGDFVAVEERVRKVVAALQGTEPLAHRPREVRIHAAELFALSALGELAGAEPGVGFALDRDTQAWLERVHSLEAQSFEPPAGLKAELRSYQLEGFRWLSRLTELGLGACLADDMGLGKTVQILALLLARAERGPALVVAPTSVCTNWLVEAQRFAPSLRVFEYTGSERAELLEPLFVSSPEASPDSSVPSSTSEAPVGEAPAPAEKGPFPIIVCSYGLLQQDVESLRRIHWGSVVLDEAQFIKNPKSLRAQAARSLAADCRIAATGTPVENHLGDLWSIFGFLNPGLLGSWRSFNYRYLKPIEQQSDTSAQVALQERIRPFILRRTKSQVLADLPPLTLVHHPVQLSEAESIAYQQLRREINFRLTSAGRRENKLEILAEITRLRRFCCHPKLVFPDAGSEASKIDALLDLVLELRENQHRALVFSQFVDFLDLVRERLDEAGVSYQYLDGSTPKPERQAAVEAFQAGQSTLFVISLKAGGFGLNLTAADYVIHLDPWWNPAVEAQATDRAHRIGQERPVTVYRLITKDTIEESIVALHQTKQALADALLSEGNQAAALNAAELVNLIQM
jgi:superfamily II DNA or RNA helicase